MAYNGASSENHRKLQTPAVVFLPLSFSTCARTFYSSICYSNFSLLAIFHLCVCVYMCLSVMMLVFAICCMIFQTFRHVPTDRTTEKCLKIVVQARAGWRTHLCQSNSWDDAKTKQLFAVETFSDTKDTKKIRHLSNKRGYWAWCTNILLLWCRLS